MLYDASKHSVIFFWKNGWAPKHVAQLSNCYRICKFFEMDLSNSIDFEHFSMHIFYRLLVRSLLPFVVVVVVIVTVLPFYTSTVAVFYFVVVISIHICFVRSFIHSSILFPLQFILFPSILIWFRNPIV